MGPLSGRRINGSRPSPGLQVYRRVCSDPQRESRVSGALEIDALGDGQAIEMAAQALEAEFDSTEPDPFAAAEDARSARLGLRLGGDRETDRAAEIDPVGAVV